MATASRKKFRKPSFIVGIGASAGGLSALERFFDNMPSDSGMAFVIIQHLSPDFKSLMDDLLARHTQMSIMRASDGMRLEANSIYLIPPKSVITVEKSKLYMEERESRLHIHLPIDIFFRSLAADAGDRAVGIIMSGTGTDGTRGIQDIHRAGGLVLVQSVDSAQFDGMPRSAISTGISDLVLTPELMPMALIKAAPLSPLERRRVLLELPAAEGEYEGEYRQIFALLRNQYNLDFSKYKPPTVGRRIHRRMEMRHATDIDAYTELLAEDSIELDALYHDLLIGVTEFFRDPKAFSQLEKLLDARFFQDRKSFEDIRVWSAGCATGEEAYSLAIILAERAAVHSFKGNITVFATDVHRSSLEFASQGIYESGRLKNVSKERLERYFLSEPGGNYRVNPALRRMIVFAPHNLISDPPFTRMDLVCCRNLLIYLDTVEQDKILSLFHFALKLRGILFLGNSEGLGKMAGEFDTIHSPSKLYSKTRDLKIAIDMKMGALQQSFSTPSLVPIPHRLTVSLDRQLVNDYDSLLREYMPPGVLINENRQIIHCFGDTSGFLRPQEGRFENDILAMIQDGLKIPLTTALQRSMKSCCTTTTRNVASGDGDHARKFDIMVECLHDEKTGVTHYFVSFVQSKPMKRIKETNTEEVLNIPLSKIPEHLQRRILDLEQELVATKESLHTTIEELQTSNEELQAANEELLAANEELQSTNEELHSVNEELYTVNSEFEMKNKELKHLNQDHENLLASINMGIVFLDRNLRIRKFNTAVESFLKLLPQDIGRPIDHIAYSLTSQEQMLKDLRSVVDSGKALENEVSTKEGQWLLKRIFPFRDETGAVGGVVVTFTDITRLKEAEQAIVQANQSLEQRIAERTRELQEAKEEADRASATKSQFLANMSHELRTPMTGVLGMLEIALGGYLDGDQRECIETAYKSSNSLLRIINDILDLTKVESGKFSLEDATFDLNSCISDTVSILLPEARRKGFGIESTIGPNVPRFVVGDQVRLRQVLTNLVGNAVKFTHEGGVEVKVTAGGKESQGRKTITFSVIDTGIGIPNEHKDLIFQAFSQADSTNSRRYGGTGLGLAISRQIAERMGGEITFESNVGGGTVFNFTASFVEAEKEDRQGLMPSMPVIVADVDSSLSETDLRPRILIAEDDEVTRNVLGRMFQLSNYEIDFATDGIQVVKMWEHGGYDLVLMDVQMPNMDGFEATGVIREKENGRGDRTPIIAMTAHALKEDEERCLAAGMDAYISKPINLKKCLDMIRNIVEKRSGGASD
jgi:signal transduction histidine kinase/chemotaxis methyl-accepting protein methylase/chemotaxis response regulator CheB